MKKLLLSTSFLFTLCSASLAEQKTTDQSALIEKLLTARTEAEFSSALSEGIQAKLAPQILLEARFLYLVDQQDHLGLAALSNELLAAKDTFNPALSSIFTLKEDWLAIIEYTLALKAQQSNDAALFEKHIKEAFWLSPRQASVFAQHIDQFRLDAAMKTLTLNTDLELPTLLEKGKSKLFTAESSATLVYFWSPWSREFAEQLDAFRALSAAAKKSNTRFISVLVEKSTEVEADARNMIAEEKLTDTAIWCTDTEQLTLSNQLRVQSAPTAVLLSPQGKVLFNDHPLSPALSNLLTKQSPNSN